MYRRFIAESTMPAPSHARLGFDGLKFFRTRFPAGSWQVYEYAAPIVYSKAPTAHIQTMGRVIDPSSVWPDHTAGWLSRRDSFVIPAGRHTRCATEESERWCCLGGGREFGAEGVDTIMVPSGERLCISPGDSVLPVRGLLRCGQAVCNSGTRIKCVSGPKELFADGDVLAFFWTSRGAHDLAQNRNR